MGDYLVLTLGWETQGGGLSCVNTGVGDTGWGTILC